MISKPVPWWQHISRGWIALVVGALANVAVATPENRPQAIRDGIIAVASGSVAGVRKKQRAQVDP